MPTRKTIFDRMARLGYAAHGLVYLIVGGLAVLAALGTGGQATDAKGALYVVLSQPFGTVLLGVVALGFLCFAAWRFAQAILDADGLGREWKALLRRAGHGVGALAGLALAWSAISIILGTGAASGGDKSAQDWTASLLSAPLGQWLVGAVGLIVAGIGIAMGVKGWKGTFQRRLALDETARGWVVPMGRFGFLARGLVFALVGAFLLLAAVHANAGEARGLAGALRALQEQPYGWVLLGMTALGLFAFGAFQFAVAVFRRIDPPEIGFAAGGRHGRVRAAVHPAGR